MQLNLIETAHGTSAFRDDDAKYEHFGKVNELASVHANGTTDERFKHHTSVVVHLNRIWFQMSPQDARILAAELIIQAQKAENGVHNFHEVEHVWF